MYTVQSLFLFLGELLESTAMHIVLLRHRAIYDLSTNKVEHLISVCTFVYLFLRRHSPWPSLELHSAHSMKNPPPWHL